MKTYTIKRKTDLKPMTLDLVVPDVDEKGKDITRPVSFGLVPSITGVRFLELSAMLDVSLQDSVNGLWETAIVEDDKERWAEWLASPNGPDFTELTNIYNDVLALYSDRQAENPTQGTPTG